MNLFHTTRAQLSDRLIEYGIDQLEAEQEAALILAHVTDLTPVQQITSDLVELKPQWHDAIENILQQRSRRVPIQYILGKANFAGREFYVKPGVLIPRQDTETLVETVLNWARLQVSTPTPISIAEIGVGAGPISISLLKELANCYIFACDISTTAIETTSENARHHGVSDRLELVCGDWRNVLPDGFDAIIANPPYVSLGARQSLAVEISQHEPPAALFDTDADGMSFYRVAATQVPAHLNKTAGFIAFEFGDGQAADVQSIFENHGWRNATVHKDVNGLPRVITATVP